MPVSEEVLLYALDSTAPSLPITDPVLIIGVGALGCPAAAALVRAGASCLTIVDFDTVEQSNLQGQVLFGAPDVGRAKVDAARDALVRMNPRVEVDAVRARVGPADAFAMVTAHRFVIDACDDPGTKFLLNTAAVRAGVPYCYGGVVGTIGQTMTVAPHRSACLACAFPRGAEDTDSLPGGCSALGVLAPVAGVIGSLQAYAALRALRGNTPPRYGRLTVFDLRRSRWIHVDFERRPRCEVCAEGDPLERRIHACRS